MYHTLDHFLAELPKRQPLAYKAVYPRRIIPPNGYLNPKYFAITLWSEIRVGFESEMNMLPHVTGLVNGLLQVQYQVPTYFVRSEFAQAVAQTEPPEDFKFSEINWPLPAMLFVLPTDFVLSYFGFLCPFLSVTNAKPGIYPKVLQNLPAFEMPLEAINPLDNQVERVNIIYPVYSKDRVPVDYTGSFPLTMNVNEMSTAPFEDATYMEEKLLKLDFDPHTVPADLPAEGEQEHLFNTKVQAFAVKLMLALTARPTVIKTGGVAREEKIKKGIKWLDALWHPNLIGWDYRAQRVDRGDATGTHASPRMHWRRGFMRSQPYGPKNTLRRLTWIEPVLINAPEEKP